MIAAEVITMRRAALMQQIARQGGAYILPEENAQPDPALRIASIHLGGIIGIGQTEAQAQSDWFRQAAAEVPA